MFRVDAEEDPAAALACHVCPLAGGWIQPFRTPPERHDDLRHHLRFR